jgi:hypothetical protein
MSFIKEKLETKFREEYERLNEKQRLALIQLRTGNGIAGPGTGKTQILAAVLEKFYWKQMPNLKIFFVLLIRMRCCCHAKKVIAIHWFGCL